MPSATLPITNPQPDDEPEFLTRPELLQRRIKHVKQLASIYRDHYWVLMEELRYKYTEYVWEFRKTPFVNEAVVVQEAAGNVNSLALVGDSNTNNCVGVVKCCVNGCKAKNMPLTRFCHMHILLDAKQKLYKPCSFSIKSSTTGPILCGKPILRSVVPSYCAAHMLKAENHMARALKKAGHHVSSTSKVNPKFHVMVAESVRQIKNKRRAAPQVKVKLENA